MHGRQKLVLVAEMVLAELAGGVAERLERLGNRDVLGAKAEVGSPAGRPWKGRCAGSPAR
jgi:hypothetical protein